MGPILIILALTSFLFMQNNCILDETISNRSIYSIGETISDEDQNTIFSVCNGANDYVTGDDFSLSDLNGNFNGSDYKISIISMNATW